MSAVSNVLDIARLLNKHFQETLSKTHYILENSRTIGHRSNQYLQKHAYKNNHTRHD